MKPETGNKGGEGLFKSVMLAYFVLVLHILLIVGLGLLVIFFRGIVQYMIWVFLFGSIAILGSFYYFYRRMKAEGRSLHEMLRSPLFLDRPVEVSLLGGLASFKVGNRTGTPELGMDKGNPGNQLEDPDAVRLREIKELARLFENDLITREEYEKAKTQIFR